jgi:hypothetical protein
MEKHLAEVRRYDALAHPDVVSRIVSHLGLSLYDRDAAYVAASDEAELETVRRSWCGKRLGADDTARIRTAVDLVCWTMAADRLKRRVTFYYLCAKQLGKVGAI